MSWRSTVTVAVVVGAVAFTAGRVFSQDAKGPDAPKAPSPEEMQKMMAEMSAPAPEHAGIVAMAGTWDADVSMWMEPGAEAMKSKGVSKVTAINGGHYVMDQYESEFMGTKFTGLGVHGFSKEKKKYVAFWCDSMNTTPMTLWGTADASGKVLTFDGEPMTCPMGGFTPRFVQKNEDADHYTFEMWSKYEGMGDYVKEMEIRYTRRK